MKKRNGELILSIMLMLLTAAGTAIANPAVDLGSGSATACGQVTVPITLTNDGIIAIAGVGVDIGYNSQYLTPSNATIGPAGQLAGKSVSQNIVSPGLFRVLIFSSSDTANIGSGIIAYVTFDIDCAAPLTTYTLQNTPSSSTANGTDVSTDGANGSISVGAATTTTTTAASVRPAVDHFNYTCITCHNVNVGPTDIHAPAAHTSNCEACHGEDHSVPQPQNCIVCHPVGNTGTCNLVNLHDPSKSTPCLSCHVNCNAATTDDHINQCLICHSIDFASTNALKIHGRSGHSNCSICHSGTPQSASNFIETCQSCHPLSGPGQCNLVDVHFPNIITSCGVCHMDCPGGVTTTTTTASGSTTTSTGGTTSIPGSTTSIVPTTTTSLPSDHYSICRTCHLPNDLHAQPSHNVCSTCHQGTPGLGNVTATQCIVCHPNGNPGQCNLVLYHGASCTSCHSVAMCADTSTTSTTTTVSSSNHYTLCSTCHLSNDLHAEPSHTVCSTCHQGTPGPGNVTASQCIVCHPNGNPGQCNLVKYHGASCTSCHSIDMCAGASTTSTTTTVSTTNHMDMCLTCHYVTDIHAKTAHSDCNICHLGTPSSSNVSPGNCVLCHPFSPGPGKCNLVIYPAHSNKCISCHADCAGGTPTTTTTTSIPSGSTTTTTVAAGGCQIIKVEPASGIKIGFNILPRIAKITVTTNSDVNTLSIIDCDFQIANNPKGIYVLGAKINGSSVQATVLFVAATPGTYTILLGECGSASITVSRF